MFSYIKTNRTVEPKEGRVSVFTSGPENRYHVLFMLIYRLYFYSFMSLNLSLNFDTIFGLFPPVLFSFGNVTTYPVLLIEID